VPKAVRGRGGGPWPLGAQWAIVEMLWGAGFTAVNGTGARPSREGFGGDTWPMLTGGVDRTQVMGERVTRVRLADMGWIGMG
jgi:hypothetical protein